MSLWATAPVYLGGNNAAQVKDQTTSWWSRMFGIGNPPAYQRPASSPVSSALAASAVGSPPVSSAPAQPTTSPPTAPPSSTAPPLREVIVVVPDSLFTSFMDQVRTVGLSVERPRE